MIQLSNTSIMIVRADSSSVPFDSEEIQMRIIRACIAAGENASWIAGDIALSVEFALLSTKNRSIRESDLDDLIIRALEDSGYPHVAADFKRVPASAPTADLPVNAKNIRNALEANFSLPEERLIQIVSNVEAALQTIGFETCSPRLILELARQFRDKAQTAVLPPIRVQTHAVKAGSDIMLLEQSDFQELGTLNLKDLLAGGSLKVHGVSRLFPALRIDVSLAAFADAMDLSKPVSELALQASWGRLLSAVDEICEKADRYCETLKDPVSLPLPLCLNFRESEAFAELYMSCSNQTSSECLRALISDFTAGLVRKPFKITDRQS